MKLQSEIIRITDASPEAVAIIRAMDEVMTASAMDQTSRYGTQTSRYMIILKSGANARAVKKFVQELGATIVNAEFG